MKNFKYYDIKDLSESADELRTKGWTTFEAELPHPTTGITQVKHWWISPHQKPPKKHKKLPKNKLSDLDTLSKKIGIDKFRIQPKSNQMKPTMSQEELKAHWKDRILDAKNWGKTKKGNDSITANHLFAVIHRRTTGFQCFVKNKRTGKTYSFKKFHANKYEARIFFYEKFFKDYKTT